MRLKTMSTVLFLVFLVAWGGWSRAVADPAESPAPAQVASQVGPAGTDHPTYNGRVAAIIDENCVSCHRPEGIAPFRLTDYRSVRRRANDIVKATQQHEMPPWKPTIGFGNFMDERHLRDADLDTLKRWVDEGTPEGTETRPQPPHFESGWTLGKPDLVVAPSKAYVVPAGGGDVYHCFVIALPFDKDTAVSAVEFDPGNSAVVHHAFFFLDNEGLARAQCKGPIEDGYNPLMIGSLWDGKKHGKKVTPSSSPTDNVPGRVPDDEGGAVDPDKVDDPGAGVARTESLGGWVPGLSPHRLPAKSALIVQRGTDLVLQVHFRPVGKNETVMPRLAIYLSHEPVRFTMRHMTIWTKPLKIPAGNPHVLIHDRVTLPVEVTVYGIAPHAHLLCKEVQASATLPNGVVLPLIWIKDWDFNWQGQYWYKKPLHLPALTRIDVHYIYDNSSKNPHNPTRPPVEVHNGWHTTDEMMHTYFTITTESERQYYRLRRHVLGREKHLEGRTGNKGEKEGQVLVIMLGVLAVSGAAWALVVLRQKRSRSVNSL